MREWEASSSTHGLSLEESESFKNTYRSLVLLDSYFATKFAYHSTFSSEEMDFDRVLAVHESVSTENNFASGLISLTRIVRTIPSNLHDNDEYNVWFVSDFMLRLSDWRDALPNDMQLAALTTTEQSNIPSSTRTAVLYLHEACLSVAVFLYCGLLPNLLEGKLARQRWTIDESGRSADKCYDEAIITAQQCIKINNLLAQSSSTVFRHCWLLLCELFTCSCVLLVDAALNIYMGSRMSLRA